MSSTTTPISALPSLPAVAVIPPRPSPPLVSPTSPFPLGTARRAQRQRWPPFAFCLWCLLDTTTLLAILVSSFNFLGAPFSLLFRLSRLSPSFPRLPHSQLSATPVKCTTQGLQPTTTQILSCSPFPADQANHNAQPQPRLNFDLDVDRYSFSSSSSILL